MDIATPRDLDPGIAGMIRDLEDSIPEDPWPEQDPYLDTTPELDEAEPDTPPSWAPIDLGAILSGNHEPTKPTLFPRSDGVCLLYPGLTHSFHGESESGKSLLTQIEAVRLLNTGGRVLYLDFESDAASVVIRLKEFGAHVESILEQFVYVNPETKPKEDGNTREFKAWMELTEGTYDLVVIDGITDAMGTFGYSINDNDEIARFRRELPEALARRTGAAVIMVDHVTKSTEGRGRFAIGGQAKLSGLSGAGYTVEIAKPLGRGMVGEIVLRVGKDRPGFVRGHAGRMRASDRTQEVARIEIDSTDGMPIVTIEPHETDSVGEDGRFRPTVIMERVCDVLTAGPLSTKRIKLAAQGKNEAIGLALDVLVDEGYVTRVVVGQSNIYTLVKHYKRAEEGKS